MHTTTTGKHLLNAGKKGWFIPQLDMNGAFPHCPTISNVETDIVSTYLEKDAKEHHIFFNDRGFHNHLTHMLLADYSLGASPDRLHQVYKQEEKMQRPKLDRHHEFSWTEHLGDENYYSDYLDFMNQEIAKLGAVEAVEKYGFEEEHNMLARLLGGVYHPYIHTGYGLEFGIDGMVAEGLAQACVHQDNCKAIIPTESILEEIASKIAPATSDSHVTALEIAKSTRDDARFDGLIKFEDSPKFNVLLKKRPEWIIEYANKWEVSSTTEDCLKKAKELMVLAAAIYAGPSRPDKEVLLDFFLMHSLTSSLFLVTTVKQLNPKLTSKLLKAKFAIDLAWYVSRNRPELHLEQFNESKEFTKSWKEIFELATNHNDEHIPKAIRALKFVERWDHVETLGKEAYRAMASMTVDNITHDKGWIQDGVGFDEAWKNAHTRKNSK